MLVPTPSMRNSLRAPDGLGHGAPKWLAWHDHLGQQRVEARVGAVAGVAEGVDAHPGPAGGSNAVSAARRRR